MIGCPNPYIEDKVSNTKEYPKMSYNIFIQNTLKWFNVTKPYMINPIIKKIAGVFFYLFFIFSTF